MAGKTGALMTEATDAPAKPVKYAKGALWGYCPKCGAPGEMRNGEGKDRCQRKHYYPSIEAKAAP